VFDDGAAGSDGTPDVSDVGALLRARTKDLNGAELGTFNDDTRPTGAQAQALCVHASDEVYAELGPYANLAASIKFSARRLVALRAAMLIELSYFPEQVRSDKSAYERYRELYEATLPRLREAARETADGDDAQPGDSLLPKYGFPADAGGMVSWGTEW
jgi:hypothetical protein